MPHYCRSCRPDLQPLLFIAGLIILPGEVFTARYVDAAFRKAGVRDIDVPAFVNAASTAYPPWARPVIITRFALTMLGSVLVVVLLPPTLSERPLPLGPRRQQPRQLRDSMAELPVRILWSGVVAAETQTCYDGPTRSQTRTLIEAVVRPST